MILLSSYSSPDLDTYWPSQFYLEFQLPSAYRNPGPLSWACRSHLELMKSRGHQMISTEALLPLLIPMSMSISNITRKSGFPGLCFVPSPPCSLPQTGQPLPWILTSKSLFHPSASSHRAPRTVSAQTLIVLRLLRCASTSFRTANLTSGQHSHKRDNHL